MTAEFSKVMFCVVIVCVIVLLDQSSKVFANAELSYGESIDIVSGLRFSLVYNAGAAFGILSEQSGWQKIFLISVSISAILMLSIWIVVSAAEPMSNLLPLALIAGGAVGNLIDRVRLGFVVDFISLYYDNWYWPTFNLADSAICIGVFLFLVRSIRYKPEI